MAKVHFFAALAKLTCVVCVHQLDRTLLLILWTNIPLKGFNSILCTVGRSGIARKITGTTVVYDQAGGIIAARQLVLTTLAAPNNEMVSSDDVSEVLSSVEVRRFSLANTVFLIILWYLSTVLASLCLRFLARGAVVTLRFVRKEVLKWYITVVWCLCLLNTFVG